MGVDQSQVDAQLLIRLTQAAFQRVGNAQLWNQLRNIAELCGGDAGRLARYHAQPFDLRDRADQFIAESGGDLMIIGTDRLEWHNDQGRHGCRRRCRVRRH